MENFFSLRIFHTPHFLHSSFSTLLIFHTPHFLHSALRTPHSALRTSHSALRTPHSALRTPHSALRTPHSALRTPHSALRTPHIFQRTAGFCLMEDQSTFSRQFVSWDPSFCHPGSNFRGKKTQRASKMFFSLSLELELGT